MFIKNEEKKKKLHAWIVQPAVSPIPSWTSAFCHFYPSSLISKFTQHLTTLTKAVVKQWPSLCICFGRQFWAAKFLLQREKCNARNTNLPLLPKKSSKFVWDECLLSFSISASWTNTLNLGRKDTMRLTAEKMGK